MDKAHTGYSQSKSSGMKSIMMIAFLVISCRGMEKSSPVINFLPRETDVPGWSIQDGPRACADSFGQHLGDRADIYAAYGLRELAYARYGSISNPGKSIRTEIYLMRDGLHAFGILGYERGFRDYRPYLYEHSCIYSGGIYCLKGGYYIKVYATQEYAGYLNDITLFAKTIYDKLVSSGSALPDYMALFTGEGKGDVVYYVRHADIPFLDNFFLKKRAFNGLSRFVYFSKKNSAVAAADAYQAIIRDASLGVIVIEQGNIKTAFYRNEKGALLFVTQYDAWIFGISGADSVTEGRDIMRSLHSELQEFIARGRR